MIMKYAPIILTGYLQLARPRIILIGAGLMLAGCAGMTQKPQSAAASEPLRRVQLAEPAPGDDTLGLEMRAEFALSSGNLAEASDAYAKAARVSDDPALVARAVRVAMAARQWKTVRVLLDRWQALGPEDPKLVQVRAEVALHDGKTDLAYSQLHKLASQSGDSGWRAVVRVLIDTPDKQQADEVLNRLAKPRLLGDKVTTWVAISQLAVHLGDLKLAHSLADNAVSRFGGASAYTWAAQLRFRSGDSGGALDLFKQALHRYPKDVHLRRSYALLLGELNKYDEAARALAAGPQDDDTYAARAAYAARAKDKHLIADLYRELQASKVPRDGDRLSLLGQVAELLKHNSEALQWYRQVPEGDDHWFQAQLRSVVLLDKNGQRKRAMNLIHELQARTADDDKQVGDAYLLEAELLDSHHQREAAVKVYDRGLKALPDDSRLLYARALLNDDLNHVDAAVRDLRRLVQLDPDNADALNALGYTLADRTQHQDEALSLIEKALALKPGEPAIIDSLGWVQYRLGHLEEAVKQLRTAYSKQPDPEIAAHLGEVLWKSGEKSEARKIWDQARKKDANNKVLLETIERFTS